MPDFSKRPGGFVPGGTASDLEVWLAVVEEWGTCSVRGDWMTIMNVTTDVKDGRSKLVSL